MEFNPCLRQDHNGAVLSVDSSSSLRLFLSCGSDTLIKLWDRRRTLLAEVQLDASLSCACFLNPSGDLLVGFRLHLYKLPHRHLFSSPRGLMQGSGSQASLTDSFVYERPELTFDGRHDDPINMESYIEPYKGFDFNVPQQDEASCTADEEDLESDWEVPHAPSLTYLSLESCHSIYSAASSQSLHLTPGQSLTDIDKLLGKECIQIDLEEHPSCLSPTDVSSRSQTESVDLRDVSTIPEAWPTESPDVMLAASPSLKFEKTSPPPDMDNPPGDQGLPVSRFANVCISIISDMKAQAKPQVKKSKIAVPDPPPPSSPPCPTPTPPPPPPPPHMPPPPKDVELKKQVTGLPTEKSGTTSIAASAKKQVSNYKQSISKPTPPTTKAVKKASLIKAAATQRPAKAPKQTQEPQRPENGPMGRSSKQKDILKDRVDGEVRKVTPISRTQKKVVDSASPPARPCPDAQPQQESNFAVGVCPVADYSRGEVRGPETQADAAGASPLMVQRKQSQRSDVTLTDATPKQHSEDQGQDEEREDGEESCEPIEMIKQESSDGFSDLHAEPMVREPSPEERETITQVDVALGLRGSTMTRLHRGLETCEQEENSDEETSSSSSVLSGGGNDVGVRSEEAEEEEEEEDKSVQPKCDVRARKSLLVHPVSEVSRSSHHLFSVRKEILSKIFSKSSMSGNHEDGQISRRSSTRFGSWVSRADIKHLDNDVAAAWNSQKQASNEAVQQISSEDQKTRKKRLNESAENWIDQELRRQLYLQRVRRDRQCQVQEKRADLEQKRLQRLVKQPYHAFCGNSNTGPDGPPRHGFSDQQGVCSICQQPWIGGSGQARPGSSGTALHQRAHTHTQGLETDQPYRLQMPSVSKTCDDSTRQSSKNQNRVLPLRPHSSASIPSKGHFMLTHSPHVPVSHPPSKIEERLLRTRFPKYYRALSAKGIIPSQLHTMH